MMELIDYERFCKLYDAFEKAYGVRNMSVSLDAGFAAYDKLDVGTASLEMPLIGLIELMNDAVGAIERRKEEKQTVKTTEKEVIKYTFDDLMNFSNIAEEI